MVMQFPIDPMHCIDLGVSKRLLVLWKEGPLPHRLSAGKIKIISDFHQAIRHYIPADFNRKPRGLDELKMWKATGFSTFLLYTGPVILKYVLGHEEYIHFLSLSVGICIISNDKLPHLKPYAEELLSYFVNKSCNLYSRKFVSYNVHCLLHLTACAAYNGTLNECSAYKFENYMTRIKRCIRGTGEPLVQIANRLAEKQAATLGVQTPQQLSV